MTKVTLSIGEFSRHFGASHRTVRYYEKMGFLRPARVNRIRYFSEADCSRMRWVEEAKGLGLKLKDIVLLLEHHDATRLARKPQFHPDLIEKQIGILERERGEVEQKLANLKAARSRSDGVAKDNAYADLRRSDRPQRANE